MKEQRKERMNQLYSINFKSMILQPGFNELPQANSNIPRAMNPRKLKFKNL